MKLYWIKVECPKSIRVSGGDNESSKKHHKQFGTYNFVKYVYDKYGNDGKISYEHVTKDGYKLIKTKLGPEMKGWMVRFKYKICCSYILHSMSRIIQVIIISIKQLKCL